VPVALDASSTAFLALDLLQSNCGPRPPCVATLPDVASGLAAARAAAVPVIYSVVGGSTILDAVAPTANDPVIMSSGADKFFNTNLDDLLKGHGINTVVITGTSANGAVLYTAFEAAARGYNVIVAVDGISSSTDFATFMTEWQLLNGPGTSNPQNMPLQPKAVTLSRSDLITYK
jgi:nicotinamidase-related amidase